MPVEVQARVTIISKKVNAQYREQSNYQSSFWYADLRLGIENQGSEPISEYPGL
jgi:hypothetical protein